MSKNASIDYRIILPHVEAGSEDRPWVICRVEALDGNDIIGYLKMAWIDYDLGKKVFPTVWHYMSAITGWCLNLKDPIKLWRGAHYYADRWPASMPDASGYVVSLCNDTPTPEQLASDMRALAKIAIYRDGYWQTPAKQMWKFLTERYNWAFVDYPRVSYEYRRRGIATQMYKVGAAWLGVHRKTCLHSSSLQSKDAVGLWSSLESSDLPIYRVPNPRHPKTPYRCLDYNQTIRLRLQAKKILQDVSQIEGTSEFEFKKTEPPLAWLIKNE